MAYWTAADELRLAAVRVSGPAAPCGGRPLRNPKAPQGNSQFREGRTMTDCRLQAVRAGHVFDGRTVLGAGMVLIQEGRILDVDTTGAAPPTEAELVDLGPDTWLLPGLIDTHVHLAFDASSDVVARLVAADDSTLLARMRDAAARALRAGITTVRDLGDRGYLSLALRQEIADGVRPGPHIVAAGPPITTPGGHCHFLGGEAAGVEAVRAAVRERHERGCSVVKVMASGGMLTAGSAAHLPQYGFAELRAAVEEAHQLGLPAAAHVHPGASVVDALAAGFDSLEHATFLSETGVDADLLALRSVAERGVFVGTTVGSLPGARPVSASALACADGVRAVRARLHRAGARMVAGSDAGTAPDKPHDVLPYGIAALVELGMTPVQALGAATVEAAAACGLGHRKGRIAQGMDADLLAVAGELVPDLSALREVRAVFREGRRAR
ncbi:amidohydrolase family protein [Streptomyces sp. WZ-12]|uniref:amidohydrolase family protein n=1 Tax=Streptomyces sp. WZ-12 TaxID=3030210 RepID=UPI0023814EFE|nr:amidohydrolase family protein [Streptomyces sp. WZ-12]